jgi:Transglutaminase-like superfamily
VDDKMIDTVISRLLDQALLRAVDAANHWPTPVHVPIPPASWGSNEVPVRLKMPAASAWRWQVPAAVALLITLTSRCLGGRTRRFARMLAIARLASRWPARPAVRADAEQATRAIRYAARVIPARVACLEESIAAMLALALMGKRVNWCHGIATDPIRFHAWIEVGGQPVDEPSSTSLCTPVLRIPGPTTREREAGTWKNR